MRAPWVGLTDDGIYDVTVARHQMLCSHTQCHPHRLHSVHQSIDQAKQIFIAPYVAGESDGGLHRDHPPPVYRMPCHNCLLSIRSSVNNQLWKFND